jgi:hypothetical protein
MNFRGLYLQIQQTYLFSVDIIKIVSKSMSVCSYLQICLLAMSLHGGYLYPQRGHISRDICLVCLGDIAGIS